MELIMRYILMSCWVITAPRRPALEPTLERDPLSAKSQFWSRIYKRKWGVGTLPSFAAAPSVLKSASGLLNLKDKTISAAPNPWAKRLTENWLQEKITHFNYLQNYAGICSGVHDNPVALQCAQTETQLKVLFFAILRKPVFDVTISSKAERSVPWKDHNEKTYRLLTSRNEQGHLKSPNNYQARWWKTMGS